MRRRLLIAAVVLAVLLLVAWFALPPIVAALVNCRLPLDAGGVRIDRMSTRPGPDGAVLLALAPHEAAALASAAGHPVPRLLLRSGMELRGVLRPDEGWEAPAVLRLDAGLAEPLLRLRLRCADLDASIARRSRPLLYAGAEWRIGGSIAWATVAGSLPSLAVRAAGRCLISGPGIDGEAAIHLVEGAVELDLPIDGGRLRPRCRVRIDRIDAPGVTGVLASLLQPLIAEAIADRLQERLDRLELPAWLPTHLRVDASAE